MQAFRQNAELAEQAFLDAFSHEERRLIMARAYWAIAADLAEQQGSTSGVLQSANLAGALASAKSASTVNEHMTDWRNNGGWFSPLMWGKNVKLASMVGDVETCQWARDWIIRNMGHVKGQKNKTNQDFNRALHDHLGIEFHEDHKLRLIKCNASLALLHKCGAEYVEHKAGSTFHDAHGADHVALKQRPAFLSLYAQLYARGPNFLQIGDGADKKYVDKDSVPNCYDMLDPVKQPGILGPRGIKLGGQPNPEHASKILPFCRAIDHVGKIWILMCHDECCIHSLKEEQYCWIIPGVEMGAMPTKSDGKILHLSEADAEIQNGCLSLDGRIGHITKKELEAYIQGKHNGENPQIPLHSSVWMHAGKGNHQEGSWTGEHALMHFELLMDQFDVLFNLAHKVSDPAGARANDVLDVTEAEREAFQYGLAIQIDRSQGHMKRDHTSLNTKNGAGMKTSTKGKQPHFKHTFSDKFPTGYTHWHQYRRALCIEGCSICAKAVAQHGSNPNFQSVGYKGCDTVLVERGFDIKGLAAPKKCELLDQQPDWVVTKSAIQEMMERRHHFGLIGAACHAELAYKEHGWARLKEKVKPYVDGKMSTLEEIVGKALQEIGLAARLGDSRKCRGVMAAYRSIAEAGEGVTTERLNLWEKVHKKHRGVHNSEISDLLLAAGMQVTKQSEASVQKQKAQEANAQYLSTEMSKHKQKLRNILRKRARKDTYDDDAKAKAKLRKLTYKINHSLDDVKRKRTKVKKNNA